MHTCTHKSTHTYKDDDQCNHMLAIGNGTGVEEGGGEDERRGQRVGADWTIDQLRNVRRVTAAHLEAFLAAPCMLGTAELIRRLTQRCVGYGV
jgi:hypothetical protein